MNKRNFRITIYILLVVFVMFFTSPSNVYAKNTSCLYDTNDTKVKISIKKDGTGVTSNAKFTKFDSNGKQAYERVLRGSNWASLAQNISDGKLDGNKMCPNYVFYVKCSGNTQNGNTDVFEWYGFYKKSTADKRYKSVNRCINGSNFVNERSEIIKNSGSEKYKVESTTDGQYDNSQASVSEKAKEEEQKEKENKKEAATIDMVGNEEANTCEEVLGTSVVNFLQKLFDYIKVLGPILVIILSSIDFTKTVLTGDEESMKKSQNNLIIRLLCAVGIFLLPTIIIVLLNLATGSGIDTTLCGIK